MNLWDASVDLLSEPVLAGERLSFSLFVGQLEQKFDQHGEEDTNDADDALAPIFIDRPHRSPITFPEEIKIDCVAKLLQVSATHRLAD